MLPSAAWQDQAWVQLSRFGPTDDLRGQGVSCLLWGVVRLQLQLPQARLLQLQSLALGCAGQMGSQALAVTVWALGALRWV
jgi:hypothetical protein